MLTGALPFAAADPLEWVHCHIARQPTPPSDRAAVPEPLSAIIMKLLAKNAGAGVAAGAFKILNPADPEDAARPPASDQPQERTEAARPAAREDSYSHR